MDGEMDPSYAQSSNNNISNNDNDNDNNNDNANRGLELKHLPSLDSVIESPWRANNM